MQWGKPYRASYRSLFRLIASLLLFGTAFGYLEAAVVSYLRILHEPARQRYYPNRPSSELFPLLTLEQVRATVGTEQRNILSVEIGREAATILMLAAVALAGAQNVRQWAAAFAIAFGIWDIAFYVGLRAILGWPESLLTWDILFLIPLPWVGPVITPILVSIAMITGGLWCLWREAAGRPLQIGLWNTAGVLLGAVVIVVSFVLDYRNIMGGGMPRSFHWGVFSLGMAIAILSYVWQKNHATE